MNLIGTKEKEDELTRYKASDRFQSINLVNSYDHTLVSLPTSTFIFSNSDSTENQKTDKANKLNFLHSSFVMILQ